MDPDGTSQQVENLRNIYSKRLNLSLREWLLYHQDQIVLTQTRYLGVKAMKTPFDAWIYQELLHRVRPEVVVEIGSAEGGSTLYLAHVQQMLGDGIVVSVDRERPDGFPQSKNLIEVTGDSSAASTFEAVRDHCENKSTLIIHDADHSYQTVLHELQMYSPLVTAESYFVVEDGIVDLFPQGEMHFEGRGPLHAIVEFLSWAPDFEVDLELERYLLTYNPHGFLRRVHQ